jgi:hypothetical protein
MTGSPPPQHIKLISLDYETGIASIVRGDGRIVTDRIPTPGNRGLVTRSTLIPNQSHMEVVAAGEVLTLVLGTDWGLVVRPVVYLDQNHWIDFARLAEGSSCCVG